MDTKQVILIRSDLNIPTGRVAAFAAHASLKVLLSQSHIIRTYLSMPIHTQAMYEWLTQRYTKVCLAVDNEIELAMYHEQAKEKGLPTALHCEFNMGDVSLAIGPANVEDIDKITGELPLYDN